MRRAPRRVPRRVPQVGKGLDFTRDGALMALAERTDGADSIGIFDADGWKPLRTFRVASTDLDDVKWAVSYTHLTLPTICSV